MTPLVVHPLTPERLPDFLAFFDGEAFADNPRWGFCYCQFSYVEHDKVEWKARTAEQNRASACSRVAAGTMHGYLAYRDGRVVGWCNAAPGVLLDALFDEPDPDAAHIGQITCFVVAKPHRGSGVATALLDAAIDGFRAAGLRIVEATSKPDAASDADNHYGPMSMFERAGFSVHATDEDGYVTLRRVLE